MDALPTNTDLIVESREGNYILHKPDLKTDPSASFVLIPYLNPSKGKTQPIVFSHLSAVKIVPEERKEEGNNIVLKAAISKTEYISKVKELQRHIQQGDIYEINFCTEFITDRVEIDPLSVFKRLNEMAKAPYSFLVRTGDEYIICASPELFLKKEGNTLITKPIKGTAPRGKSREEDEKNKNDLFQSVKERTENVMAVDVARNDLSILAERGSVEVNKLYNIETYETVHQMVSTVKCKMEEGRRKMEEIIRATFPMASMTGAPKQSAMNLIDKFENFERKYYSGAMGPVRANGDFELCVIIRSIFYNERSGRLSIAVGSAITHLCDPEKEYEECLLKTETMLKALRAKIG